ncbi:MAG: hypothetical protein M3430_00150, partial [Acidobacteriota bacterium]|nr:hypothetical protein [Acidobacteriota bacterium]
MERSRSVSCSPVNPTILVSPYKCAAARPGDLEVVVHIEHADDLGFVCGDKELRHDLYDKSARHRRLQPPV